MEIPFFQGIPEKILLYGCVIYIFFSRVLPFILATLIQYKYKCSIRIGHVGLPISLHHVTLKTVDFSIYIERIGFTSSFVSSEAPKLLSVVITCIKVVKLTTSRSSTSPVSKFSANGGRTKVKAPQIISNLVQFLGIHVNEIRMWGWQNIDGTRCFHCPILIENVCVDGCTTVGGTQISACIVVSFQRCRVRLNESWTPTEIDLLDPTSGPLFYGTEGITIVECDFDFRLNLIFSPRNSGDFVDHLSIDVEKLVIWWELKATIINSFNKVIQNKENTEELAIDDGSKESDFKNWVERIEHIILSQLVPKDIKFRIFETECNITVDESKTDLDSKVSGFSFSSRCNVITLNDEELVSFESQLDLGLIRIEPDRHQSFSLDQFSNYIKLANNNLTIDIDFSQFALRSFDRSLQFIKTRFMSNLELIQQFPRGQFVVTEVFRSIKKVTLESLGFDLCYSNKSLNFSSAFLEAHCQDLTNVWVDNNSSVEVVIKHFNTSLTSNEDGHDVIYRPASFDIVGFHLQRERVGAKIAGSRFEWVPQIETFILALLPIFEKVELDPNTKKLKKRKKRKKDVLKGFNIEVFDCRIIYMADNNLCLNADVGSIIFESDSASKKWVSLGFEVFSSSTFSDCTLNPLFSIPKCSFNAEVGEINKYDFVVESDAIMYWSPLIHKQALEFTEKITSLLPRIWLKRRKRKTKTKSTMTFNFSKEFSLVGKLARDHSFKFEGRDWKVDIGEDHFTMFGIIMEAHFDDNHIAQIEGFQLSRSPDTVEETLRFRKSANLSQKTNRVWVADITKLCLTFPHGYNFASAFNDEFITCFKWLKSLHRKPNSSPTILWSDILIKFSTVRIEVGDDPFEVKLRDNYELLEDEYFESLKRHAVLDTKINQLCKNNPLMSSSKFDELRKQLLEKSSNIYIQRSKQLYKNHPIRTHLLLWEFDSVQIVALADPSMFGAETVKNIIKELDPESPWPTEGIEFSTLWSRFVRFEVMKWRVQLRDFPQPLMDTAKIYFWGKFAAAEAEATKRSRRTCKIEIGGPFGSEFIERSLNGLKWYYDLNCDTESLSLAFGPCWEPVLAQCNLSLENIFSPSKDPSKPLPFWDKIRLQFHGQLYMAVNSLTFFLHASLNPYNTTEEMEVTWTGVGIAWTNGKIIFDGDLDIYVRTASKYDDCRMIHMPNVRLTFKLFWGCLADCNDHHAIQLCAPDRLPEYSSNQEHDSYRAFRSEHLNMNVSLETKKSKAGTNNTPTAALFGSTLRWFENLKLILSGTTRPTRRGVLFRNVRPRKVPISRHYKKVRLSISLHRFHVCYWVSFSKQSGIELVCGKFSSSSEHQLTLQPITDNLIHRPKADWSFLYVNSAVNDTEIWLQSSSVQETSNEVTFTRPVEKFFFMSVDKLSYGRDAFVLPSQDNSEGSKTDTPQHRLVVHELKGAWTNSNRDVAFSLFDSFVKVQQLKKNLSTEALRSFFSKHDGPSGSPRKTTGNVDAKGARGTDVSPPTSGNQVPRSQIGSSPLSSLQGSSAAASLLQKLVSEVDSHGVVFSEDLSAPPPQQSLHGLVQCNQDDVIHQKWLIELVNCQVLLKGCETKGYVIVCSSKAHVLQREHKPVWKHGTIVPKTTWVGTLEGMQYYATVSPGNTESIQWVLVADIEERDSTLYSTVPEMVGSGQSVGGVVSETVGESSDSTGLDIQLQRIISRCKCEFFYTTYGETGVDKIPSGIPDIPPGPTDFQIWDEANKPVEAFTLMHHDLEVFTNSLQYAMIMDIVNNLVLYVDPKRKEGFEKLQRLRFKLQLQSTEAQRRPIQQLQNHLRSLVNQLRRLEKETYAVHKSQQEDPNNDLLHNQRLNLEQQVNECKEQVAAKGEELHMMIMCYKEAKLATTQRLSRMRENNDVTLVRVYEICFKQAQWRLTQTDGQLGIADLALSNFLYTKAAKSDDSVEHLSELGYITVTNLLPNQVYKEVLVPSFIHASMPVDRQRTLRVFCRDKPPVGGIAVKEHFEINIAPITIGMTYQFFKTLFKFCFPEKDPEKLDDVDLAVPCDPPDGLLSAGNSNNTGTLESQHSVSSGSSTIPSTNKGKKPKKKKESKFYVAVNEKDDVEKMKERAEKNMLFICVKIPEVPVRVSYKGEKEKNIEDVHDARLILPIMEFNNITWTWLDFLVAVRNHSKRVLLSQAIKQKLQIWPKAWPDNEASPQEEDKAKMLLGHPIEVKSLKKSLFGSKK